MSRLLKFTFFVQIATSTKARVRNNHNSNPSFTLGFCFNSTILIFFIFIELF